MQLENANTFFSIIIPCLNEEEYLPNLLTDLKNQTFKDFEVIVVDGNSSDRTVKNAKKFDGQFKKFQINTTKKRNVSFQRNIGFSKATSDWIIFMDADDRLPHYFLQGIKYKVEKYNPKILTTAIKPDSNNSKDKSFATLINLVMDVQKRQSIHIIESMVIIRKNIFHKLHGFDEKVHWGEGGDLLRRAKKINIRLTFTRDPVYTYSFRRLRKHGTLNVIRSMAIQEWAILRNKKIPKDKAEKLYPLDANRYVEIDKNQTSRLEALFKKLSEYSPGNGITNKKRNKLLEGLRKFLNS